MDEIAKTLKEARHRLGLTLEESEKSTRIRAHYLEALENGDIKALPSQVQARGFLKNYAEFLGLDTQPILQRYAEVVHSQRTLPLRRARLDEPTTQPSVRVRRRRISADLVIAAVVTLTVLAVLIWGFGLIATSLRDRARAASPFLIPTFTPEPEVTTAQPEVATGAIISTPTPPAIEIPAILTNALDLRLLVERRAWVSVEVDGETVYAGRARPGELLEFQGVDKILVTTGNGGGLRAFFRGKDQGLLGELNEVVIRLWVPEGAVTPTPSPTSESPE